jgi:hypothetical protein
VFKFLGAFVFSNKYFCGGPRLPNSLIVTIVGVLQLGQQCNSVFGVKGVAIFLFCKAGSLCGFQALFKIAFRWCFTPLL